MSARDHHAVAHLFQPIKTCARLFTADRPNSYEIPISGAIGHSGFSMEWAAILRWRSR